MAQNKTFPYSISIKILLCSALIALFFVAIGIEDSFWSLFSYPEFYLDWLWVTLIVFVVVGLMYKINSFLDEKYPWTGFFRKRLLFQFALNLLLIVLFSFFLVYGYMEFVLGQDIFETTYFIYELPISVLVIGLINMVFVIQFLVSKETPSKAELHEFPQTILVNSGNTKVVIETSHIQLIEKEGSICLIFRKGKERLIYYGTLEDLELKLDPDIFFRSNRQTIVQRSNCEGFESERSGQLILNLKVPEGKKITISQKKSKDFKTWLLSKN